MRRGRVASSPELGAAVDDAEGQHAFSELERSPAKLSSAKPQSKEPPPAHTGVAAAALVLLSSSIPVATAAARRADGSYPFETVGVLLRAEVLKLSVSALMLARELRGLSPEARRERAEAPTCGEVALLVALGTGYQALNALSGYAMRLLAEAKLFAVIVQTKIVWTGLLSAAVFRRWPSVVSAGALVVVAAGAVLCVADFSTDARVSGVAFTAAAAFLSALMTVACEAFMKRSSESLHWINFQLYVVGVCVQALAVVVAASGDLAAAFAAATAGGSWALLLVVLQASNGLAISVVLRRTDAVVKTLVTTLSIPGVALLEHALRRDMPPPPPNLMLGGAAVVLAIAAHQQAVGARARALLLVSAALVAVGGLAADPANVFAANVGPRAR